VLSSLQRRVRRLGLMLHAGAITESRLVDLGKYAEVSQLLLATFVLTISDPHDK
jgi:hypothetical protein